MIILCCFVRINKLNWIKLIKMDTILNIESFSDCGNQNYKNLNIN